MSTSSYTAPVPGCQGSNLAIVSLSASCQISINTFPSGKPSSLCASVYLFRPITNTSTFPRNTPPRQTARSQKVPALTTQARDIPAHPSFQRTIYTDSIPPRPTRQNYQPQPFHMSMLISTFFCYTLFPTFYPVYHKTVQIPSNSEQSLNILFHNICCSIAANFIFLLHFRSRCAILPK